MDAASKGTYLSKKQMDAYIKKKQENQIKKQAANSEQIGMIQPKSEMIQPKNASEDQAIVETPLSVQ